MLTNIIVLLIVLAIVFFAARYIYKAKKKGQQCIGCPSGGTCCHCDKE